MKSLLKTICKKRPVTVKISAMREKKEERKNKNFWLNKNLIQNLWVSEENWCRIDQILVKYVDQTYEICLGEKNSVRNHGPPQVK